MAAVDPEVMRELGLAERTGFAVYDWSTSPNHWKFSVRQVTYLVDAQGKLWGALSGKCVFTPGQTVLFETIEDIYFPDAETARTAVESVARANGREYEVHVHEAPEE